MNLWCTGLPGVAYRAKAGIHATPMPRRPSRPSLIAAAWAAGALAVVLPAWQFGQVWQDARAELRARAQWEASLLGPATAGDRATWPAPVNALLDPLPGTERRILVDIQGRLVGSTTAAVPWPALQVSAPVQADGWQRGQLTLSRSMRPALWGPAALALALAGLAAAAGLAGAARRPRPDTEPSSPWAELLFEQGRDGIVIFDADGIVRRANAAAAALFGTAAADLAGQPLRRWLTLPASDTEGRHHVLVRGAGEALPCELTLTRMPAGTAEAELAVATLHDLSDRHAAERHVRMMVDYDSLTGLPNRSLFRDRLGQAMARADRTGLSAALLFLDLDRFKHVNDSLGHDAGDRLLQHVADTLTATLRSGDSVARRESGDDDVFTVARLGGDEFTVVLEDLPHAEEAARIAKRLLRALERPFMLGNQELVITGSIGLTVYPADRGPPEELLQHADQAMYRAKEQGRNAVQFYSDEMNQRARQRLQLEASCARRWTRGEFQLHLPAQGRPADAARQRRRGAAALAAQRQGPWPRRTCSSAARRNRAHPARRPLGAGAGHAAGLPLAPRRPALGAGGGQPVGAPARARATWWAP